MEINIKEIIEYAVMAGSIIMAAVKWAENYRGTLPRWVRRAVRKIRKSEIDKIVMGAATVVSASADNKRQIAAEQVKGLLKSEGIELRDHEINLIVETAFAGLKKAGLL